MHGATSRKVFQAIIRTLTCFLGEMENHRWALSTKVTYFESFWLLCRRQALDHHLSPARVVGGGGRKSSYSRQTSKAEPTVSTDTLGAGCQRKRGVQGGCEVLGLSNCEDGDVLKWERLCVEQISGEKLGVNFDVLSLRCLLDIHLERLSRELGKI